MTVVRDDADALVAWLARGTPVLQSEPADGRAVRAWQRPFGDGWEHWRPDPGWPLPGLPPG